jgi:hypothetical protein
MVLPTAVNLLISQDSISVQHPRGGPVPSGGQQISLDLYFVLIGEVGIIVADRGYAASIDCWC